MILTRRTLLTATGAAAATALLPAPAIGAVGDRLTPSAMQADFALLRRAYGAVHPGLRRYLPAGGFDARIEAARAWAARDRSLSEMFVMLARLTAAVRCGHSYPNPNNQRRAARAALFDGRDRVPFAFRWIGGRMIVTGGRGGDAPVPPGSEVIAVDGTASGRLLRLMMPLARADGGNDAKRVAQLEVDPRERFAAFDVYRPMIAPGRTDGLVRLDIRDADGVERRLELPARTEADLDTTRPTAGAGLGWRSDIDADGIGTLTMPSWVTYRSDWDWRAFIDAAVDRLVDERARGLVVDLRGNEGGTECGWRLLERLVAVDTPLPGFVPKVRYRALPATLREPLDTWDPGFRDWGAAAVGPDADGFYRLDRAEHEVARVTPRGRRFAGPVAVLVDASCSSATFQFAEAVRTSGVATLVGETTGGNRRGINGGAYFFVRLPGSGLEVDLPVVGMFAKTPQPDAGVRPDIHVPVTAQDIADRRDRQMEAAVATLRAGGRRL